MEKTLHLLPKPPDIMVEKLIETMSGDRWATVIPLYEDGVSHTPVNWSRVVDAIFKHEKIVCWW